jgi:hypothetical protein
MLLGRRLLGCRLRGAGTLLHCWNCIEALLFGRLDLPFGNMRLREPSNALIRKTEGDQLVAAYTLGGFESPNLGIALCGADGPYTEKPEYMIDAVGCIESVRVAEAPTPNAKSWARSASQL